MPAMDYPRLLLAAFTLLLPSCLGWQTGYCVMELPQTCIGADVGTPIGGLVYEDKSAKPYPYPSSESWTYPTYVRAAEVSYSPASPALRLSTLYQPIRAQDLQPTGHERWVRLSEYGTPEAFVEELPRGAVARKVTEDDARRLGRVPYGDDAEKYADAYGRIETTNSGWQPLATVAGAMLFPVDVVLTVATNASLLPIGLVGTPIVAIRRGLPPQMQKEDAAGGAEGAEE